MFGGTWLLNKYRRRRPATSTCVSALAPHSSQTPHLTLSRFSFHLFFLHSSLSSSGVSVDRKKRQAGRQAISFLSFTNCVLGKWIGSARSTCLSFPRLETDWTAQQQQQLGTDRVSYRTTNGCPATDGIDGHHSSSSLDLRHKQNNNKKSVEFDWLAAVHVTCPDHLVTSCPYSNRQKKGGERKIRKWSYLQTKPQHLFNI